VLKSAANLVRNLGPRARFESRDELYDWDGESLVARDLVGVVIYDGPIAELPHRCSASP
jgi:hypothetical protein